MMTEMLGCLNMYPNPINCEDQTTQSAWKQTKNAFLSHMLKQYALN